MKKQPAYRSPLKLASLGFCGLSAFVESFLQDLLHSLRSLVRASSYTLVTVLMLALGIGATTAVFSVVKAVLLDPLPYPEAGNLVRIFSKGRFPRMGLSLPNFEDIRNQQTSFTALAAWRFTEVNLTGGQIPLRARTARFSPGFFDVVGVQPMIGAPIQSEDDHMVEEEVAVLGYGTWQRIFGGEPEVVGRTIELDDQAYIVCGVMPPGFDFPGGIDIWIPWDVKAERWANRRDANLLSVIARIASDVTVEEAQTELDLLWKRLAGEQPEVDDVAGLEIVPEFEITVGDSRAPLLVLMGAVILVLLVVCVNVAGLSLGRGVLRQREIALRSALGAGIRMVRHLLTEILLLCLAGCGLGLILAHVDCLSAYTFLLRQLFFLGACTQAQ